jgi:hypothetical protein
MVFLGSHFFVASISVRIRTGFEKLTELGSTELSISLDVYYEEQMVWVEEVPNLVDGGGILHDGENIEIPTALLPPSRQHRYLKKKLFVELVYFEFRFIPLLFRMEPRNRANNKPFMAQPRSQGCWIQMQRSPWRYSW